MKEMNKNFFVIEHDQKLMKKIGLLIPEIIKNRASSSGIKESILIGSNVQV